MRTPKLLFTDSAAPFILEALGYEFSPAGFIQNSTTKMMVTTASGETVHRSKFGGVYKDDNGETIFVKSDLRSIMDMVDSFKTE